MYQWTDVLPGEPPESLANLPCDEWIPKDNGNSEWVLLCLFCTKEAGWYRHLPLEDLEAANRLRAAIDAKWEEEDG